MYILLFLANFVKYMCMYSDNNLCCHSQALDWGTLSDIKNSERKEMGYLRSWLCSKFNINNFTSMQFKLYQKTINKVR